MVGLIRGRGPRPGATPPAAKRMPVVGGDRPPPVIKRPKRDLERGRVVSFFGPPGTGIDRILLAVHEECTTPTALVVAHDELDQVDSQVLEFQQSVDVVLLDGLPRSVEDVQWLYDRRYVSPAGGQLVRVSRNAVHNPAFEASLPALEAAIIALSLPYTVVFTDDPVSAAAGILSLAGIQ